MTAPDTSPEAVEKRAKYFDSCLEVCVEYDQHASVHANTCESTAAMLRALSGELARAREALAEIVKIGTARNARDNGPNYIANRMYHVANSALAPQGPSHG